MTVFFISDTHFGDHRVLNLYPRPFPSVAAMDEGMIERWNEVVGPDDEVWHLGDFARTAAQAEAPLWLTRRKTRWASRRAPSPVSTKPTTRCSMSRRGSSSTSMTARSRP